MLLCGLHESKEKAYIGEYGIMELTMNEKIDIWRQKAVAGTLSLEEMREAIAVLRAGRAKATTAAKTKATSKKVINSEDLLGELDAI